MAKGDNLPTVWERPPHMKAKHDILVRYLGAWFGIFGLEDPDRLALLDPALWGINREEQADHGFKVQASLSEAVLAERGAAWGRGLDAAKERFEVRSYDDRLWRNLPAQYDWALMAAAADSNIEDRYLLTEPWEMAVRGRRPTGGIVLVSGHQWTAQDR